MQQRLLPSAKATAKRKAAEKAEKGAGAKAKAKVKAQAQGKAKGSAAKPKATAKGKARPKAAMKRPAAASPDMDAQQPTLAEEEEETPEKVNKNNADKSAASNSRQTCEMSEEVKRLEADGVIPHTFGGRGRPSKGWGLEKYARTAEAFKLHIEPQLEGRTKHKAQARLTGKYRLFALFLNCAEHGFQHGTCRNRASFAMCTHVDSGVWLMLSTPELVSLNT